jgi:hypothetical protein
MNSILFTIGRMNPPTSGHLKLIQAMMEANVALPADDLGHGTVYILLSHTKNNVKDPLTCERKRSLLSTEGMINSIKERNPQLSAVNVVIFCKEDKDVPAECGEHWLFKQICRVRVMEMQQKGVAPTKMILFIGEDRAGNFAPMLSKVLESYNPPIAFAEQPLERPAGAMSATAMRGLVTTGDKATFIQLSMANGLSNESADNLFDELDYELKPVVKTKRQKTSAAAGPSAAGPSAAGPSASMGGKKRRATRMRATKRHATKRQVTRKRHATRMNATRMNATRMNATRMNATRRKRTKRRYTK